MKLMFKPGFYVTLSVKKRLRKGKTIISKQIEAIYKDFRSYFKKNTPFCDFLKVNSQPLFRYNFHPLGEKKTTEWPHVKMQNQSYPSFLVTHKEAKIL